MPFRSETFTEISNRIKNWLIEDNTGSSVSRLDLDLANRAQRTLNFYRPWKGLLKYATLSVSSKQATLPSDMARLIAMGHDSDNDKRWDWFYFKEDSNVALGYRIVPTFAKSSGYSEVVHFYQAPNYSPEIMYIHSISDFVGTGTEYSFFPADLIDARAHLFHLESNGGSQSQDYKYLLDRERKILEDIQSNDQYQNIHPKMFQLDENGVEIFTESYSLSDGPWDSVHTLFSDERDVGY